MAVGDGQGGEGDRPLRPRFRQEQLVHDEIEPCPYLPGEDARLPLRLQNRPLTPARFDASLAAGDRRVGRMLYRTSCPSCTACEPIRIPVETFSLSRSQKRVLKRNADLIVETGPAVFSPERLELYHRHKFGRDLDKGGGGLTRIGYESWFVQTCTQTLEMTYWLDGELIGVGIIDVGERDASSVYFFFDPEHEKRSLGVYSTLMEIAWLRSRGGRYHYLGLYVAECRHLSYKASYGVHERLIEGEWKRFGPQYAEAKGEEPT